MSQPDPRHTVALFRYGLIAEFVHLPPSSPGIYAKVGCGRGGDRQGTVSTGSFMIIKPPWPFEMSSGS